MALGGNKEKISAAVAAFKHAIVATLAASTKPVDLDGVRDGLTDIHVFAYGAHHLMGIDADRDMASVIDGVMTRFVKNDEDLNKTLEKHAKNGITEVYTEGEYPTLVVKSAVDQQDAPKGKFLKSASYTEPVFYTPT